MRNHMRNSKGFSLLELLIVAGIFMFVLIPVVTVFTSSYESYLVQDDISATQQNMRSAMMYLRRDVRMAGAGLGDGFFTFDFFGENGTLSLGDPIQVYGISAGNGIGPNGSDELTIRFVNLDEGLCGAPGEPNLCSDLPNLVLPGGMPSSSAEATVSSSTGLTEEPYSNWYDFDPCKCGDDLWPRKERPVMITSPDGKTSDLMIVSQVQPNAGQDGGHLQNRPIKFEFKDNTFDVDNKIANDYPPGSTISFFNIEAFQRLRYFLDPDNPTVLMRQLNNNPAQPLAEGIEDLQFDYFGDFNQDGAEEWYNENYNFDPPGDGGNFMDEEDQTRVRMVRIRLLARTSKEWQELGESDKPVLDEFAGADPVSDNFRRRVVVQDVQTRNIGLE